jgi:hypothetical protein
VLGFDFGKIVFNLVVLISTGGGGDLQEMLS